MKTLATIAFAAAAILGLSATSSQAGFSPISLFAGFQQQQRAAITARVSISEQKMYLDVTDASGLTKTYVWKVSTGKIGYATPTGAFQPTWLDADHRSKTYDDAPMPYAVFFSGGYAVHATDAVARLGKPASHGCVRLAPQNAAAFFQMVNAAGKRNTSIVIVD
jgi:lipoprotein-anchoring transpeptidase ErfK/SrfK